MTIRLNNLHIGVHQPRQVQPLVTDVSFHVDEGETLAIVGESGSGKSITALSLMGLMTAWNARSDFEVSGSLDLGRHPGDTIDLAAATDQDFDPIRARHLSIIFQDPWTALNPITSVGRQLTESIRAHPAPAASPRERALELMHRVGIQHPEEKIGNYPHQLSGGQLQRIMIAMALASEPRFLIADEPTTALDVTVQKGILALLDALRQDGLGILLITHDLSVVATNSARIVVMYGGQVVEYGPSREVIFNPAHPYTHLLVSSVPTLAAQPGSRLVTKEDILSGRGLKPGIGRFDPHRTEASQTTQVGAEHFVSDVFVGAP